MSHILRKVKACYEIGKGEIIINYLLFMDDLKLFGKNEKELETLMNTVRIFSNDIRMDFEINKCGVLIMKRGKLSKVRGSKYHKERLSKSLIRRMATRSVLETDSIKDKEMKTSLKREYLRRIRTILKSKLNSKNVITAINSCGVRAVSIIQYSAGVIK